MIPLFTYTIFSAVQEWTNLTVPANALTAILSVVLLASAIPVLRAKDPLIERKMQERRYREYTCKVGKIAQESKKQ